MNRKNLISFMMILGSLATFAQEDTYWSVSKEAKHRVPHQFELGTRKAENAAYTDFLRVIDEINRKAGNSKKYINGTVTIPEVVDNIDIVPIYSSGIEFYGNPKEIKANKFYSRENFKTEIEKTDKKDLGYAWNRNVLRYYFGNGNTVNNIIIESKDKFDKSLATENKRYLIDGIYKQVESKDEDDHQLVNPLGITEADYKKNFLDGNGNELSLKDTKVLNFVKGRLKDMGIEVTVKNGELWTDNGEHKLIWTSQKASLPNLDYYRDLNGVMQREYENPNSDKRYKNTIFTKIFKYEDVDAKTLLTEDGSIYREDIVDYDTKSTEGIEKTITEEKIVANAKKMLEDFALTKEFDWFGDPEMEVADFEGKWDLTGIDYEAALNELKTVAKPIQDQIDQVERDYKSAEREKSSLLGYQAYMEMSAVSGTLYNTYMNNYHDEQDPAKREEVYNSFTPEEKVVVDKYIAAEKKIVEKLIELATIKKEKFPGWEKEIAALYASKILGTDLERMAVTDAINVDAGNQVILNGRGRVDGEINLGREEGLNALIIKEEESGKYGTNITFGPNVVLKNIDVVEIGGQKGIVGLSGVSALSIEVDPNKKDKDGHLYQHALKDTWTKGNKVVFRAKKSDDFDERNNFKIEFKVSSLGKDEVIDMGRPLEYKGPEHDFTSSSTDEVDYKINLVSDSIAHQLEVLNEKTDKGNNLVKVNLKDSLKRLDTTENEIYKSLKNSGHLGALSDTLTTSNKQTIFSSPEDDMLEKEKTNSLTSVLKGNITPDEAINQLAQFSFDRNTLDDLKDKIEKVEKDQKVIDSREQTKLFNEYKKINMNPAREAIHSITSEFTYIPEGIVGSEDLLHERVGDTAKIAAKVEEIKKLYATKLKNVHDKLVALAPSDSAKEPEVYVRNEGEILSSTATPGESLRKIMAKIENPDGATPEAQLLNLVSFARLINQEMFYLEDAEASEIDDILTSDLMRTNILYQQLRNELFYTLRQEQSLREFKTLTNQLYKKNIYAKVNKISKDEVDMFMPMVVDHDFDFASKKSQATGGAISSRFAKDEFKGTIYTGFGIYETPVKEDLSLGFVVGGGSSDFHEIANDDNKTVTTNSKIKGTRAYLGTFGRYQVKPNITWVNGLGIQYASYDVDRDMKNNYQQETYKGEVTTYTGNIYSNLVYNYKINDTLDASIKGGLSYTLVNQGKVSEEDKPLGIEIDAQNFNYLDGQVGVGLTKTIYGNEMSSSLGGTLYAVYGILGYDNEDLKGNFKGSSSGFDIQGDSYEKQSVKLKLDYNVKYDSGFNYGLEGSYTTNSNEDNISVGVKAGYKF